MEKEGEKEGMTKEKDRRKEDDRKRKTAAKVSFLRQCYPDTHTSPGGSVQITRHSNLKNILSTDGNSDRETGKTVQNNILETSSQVSNTLNSLFSKKNKKKITM